MMPNCREWVVAWMALARIGAVMTAVNPYYKPAELSFVLNDSDAQLLIAHEQCIPTFDAMDAVPELIAIGGVVTTGGAVTGDRHDFDRLVAVGSSSFEPPVPPESADLLAIQYTSGTTGFPKGCMQTHQYWRQVSTLAAEAYGQGIERILVTFPLYYFDPQAQIMMALQSGMTVYLANRHSLSEFMGWVKKYKIQTCSMTPQASNNMPVSDDDADTDLRHIIGYYYRGDEHFEAEKRFGVPVRELFGMTEIGIGTLVPLTRRIWLVAIAAGLRRLVESSRFEMMRVNLSRWVSQGRFGSEARGCFWGITNAPKRIARALSGIGFGQGI